MTGKEKHWLNDYQDILRALSADKARHVNDLATHLEAEKNDVEDRVTELAERNFIEYPPGPNTSHKRVKLQTDSEHWIERHQDIIRTLQENNGSTSLKDSLRFAVNSNPYNNLDSRLDILEKHGYITRRASGRDSEVILTGYEESFASERLNEEEFLASYEHMEYGGENLVLIKGEEDTYVSRSRDKMPE